MLAREEEELESVRMMMAFYTNYFYKEVFRNL